jgi:hypothetical protein
VGDFNFTAVGFLWWLAMAIVFSVWANASNTAGNDGECDLECHSLVGPL